MKGNDRQWGFLSKIRKYVTKTVREAFSFFFFFEKKSSLIKYKINANDAIITGLIHVQLREYTCIKDVSLVCYWKLELSDSY